MTIHRVGGEREVYEAPGIRYHAHHHLFDEFLNWLEGGKPSDTRIEDNIKSFALVIAVQGRGPRTTVNGINQKLD